MRIFVVAIAFAVTVGGLFLFENYKTPPQETNCAKIVSDLEQSSTPTVSPYSSKTPVNLKPPLKQPPASPIIKLSPSPTPSPSPISHVYYTSSASQAKYYYCDTDSGWKNLSKANLKQFSSPEELLKSYPNRILHEPCK